MLIATLSPKKPAARIRQGFVPVDMWPTVLNGTKDKAFRDYRTVMLSTGARAMEMRKFEAKHARHFRDLLPPRTSAGDHHGSKREATVPDCEGVGGTCIRQHGAIY